MRTAVDAQKNGILQLACVSPYAVTPTLQATAYTSTSSFLYVYAKERDVLWLETPADRTETGSATYAFSAGTAVGAMLTARAWDFSSSNTSTMSSATSVALSPTPSFIA